MTVASNYIIDLNDWMGVWCRFSDLSFAIFICVLGRWCRTRLCYVSFGSWQFDWIIIFNNEEENRHSFPGEYCRISTVPTRRLVNKFTRKVNKTNGRNHNCNVRKLITTLIMQSNFLVCSQRLNRSNQLFSRRVMLFRAFYFWYWYFILVGTYSFKSLANVI